MKTIWLLILGNVIILNAAAEVHNKKAIKYEDLKPMIESRNEKLRGKSKEYEGAKERQGALGRSFFPTVELYAAQENFEKGPLPRKSQPAYGAEARLNIYNGGRDQLESERRTLVAERKGYERALTLSTELSKAREAYWRVLYLRDYIDLLKEARLNTADSSKAAERRIKGGVATSSDRVEFEIHETELKREQERAVLEQQNHIRTLSVVLGFDDGISLDFPEVLKHEHDWESAINHTEVDHIFLVKPAELHARESEALATIQRRAWFPKLDAYAAYNQLNQREEEDFADASDRQESVLGVRMSMSFFDGLKGRREAAALSAESEAAKAEARYVHREVVAHLHGEIDELKLLHNQVHDAEANIGRAVKYYKLTQSEYARGVKNSPDMLGATEKLISIRHKRLEIIRDFQVSKSHVLAKIGK